MCSVRKAETVVSFEITNGFGVGCSFNSNTLKRESKILRITRDAAGLGGLPTAFTFAEK